jgi:hypothetical protein
VVGRLADYSGWRLLRDVPTGTQGKLEPLSACGAGESRRAIPTPGRVSACLGRNDYSAMEAALAQIFICRRFMPIEFSNASPVAVESPATKGWVSGSTRRRRSQSRPCVPDFGGSDAKPPSGTCEAFR